MEAKFSVSSVDRLSKILFYFISYTLSGFYASYYCQKENRTVFSSNFLLLHHPNAGLAGYSYLWHSENYDNWPGAASHCVCVCVITDRSISAIIVTIRWKRKKKVNTWRGCHCLVILSLESFGGVRCLRKNDDSLPDFKRKKVRDREYGFTTKFFWKPQSKEIIRSFILWK